MNPVVTKFIRSASNEDLEEIIVAVKARRNVIAMKAALDWNVEDRVIFDSGKWGQLKGTIKKVNSKSVKILVDKKKGDLFSSMWNVSPTFLRRLKSK